MNRTPDKKNQLILSESDEDAGKVSKGEDEPEDEHDETHTNTAQSSYVSKRVFEAGSHISRDFGYRSSNESSMRELVHPSIYDKSEHTETDEEDREEFQMFSPAGFNNINIIYEEADDSDDGFESGSETQYFDQSASENRQTEMTEQTDNVVDYTESSIIDDDDEEEAIIIANKVAEVQERMVRECAARMVFFSIKRKIIRLKREALRKIVVHVKTEKRLSIKLRLSEKGSNRNSKAEQIDHSFLKMLTESQKTEVVQNGKEALNNHHVPNGTNHLKACRMMIREFNLQIRFRMKEVLLRWRFTALSMAFSKVMKEKAEKEITVKPGLKSDSETKQNSNSADHTFETEKKPSNLASTDNKLEKQQQSVTARLSVNNKKNEQQQPKIEEVKIQSTQSQGEPLSPKILQPPLLLSEHISQHASALLPKPFQTAHVTVEKTIQQNVFTSSTLAPPLLLPNQQSTTLTPPLLLPVNGGLLPPNLLGNKGLNPPSLLELNLSGKQNVIAEVPKRIPPKNLQGKKVHFNAITRFKLGTTFWGNPIPSPGPKIKPLEVDYEALEQKFFEKKKSAEQSKLQIAKEKLPQFTLIDSTKLNNTNIVLTSFTQPLNEIVDIIIECTDDLTVEQLSKLIMLIPNDDDRKKLNEYKGDLSNLIKVERFLKKFVEIPRLKQRLDSMIFKKNYLSDHDEFKQKVEDMHEPFLILKSCPKFQYVMKFVLEVFNYLNYGTNKANQPGFTIDVLNSLDSIKSFDKSTSMLVFIVDNIQRADKDYLTFIDDFKSFAKGCAMEVGDLEKNYKDLGDGITKIETEIEELRKIGVNVLGQDGEDIKKRAYEHFNSSFPLFLEDCKKRNMFLMKKLEQLKDDVRAVGEQYGENKEYKTKDFLTNLMNFANSVRAAIQKIEEKKIQDLKNTASGREVVKLKPQPIVNPEELAQIKLALKKKEEANKISNTPGSDRSSFKERVSISMRSTILQLKKNIHLNKGSQNEKAEAIAEQSQNKAQMVKLDTGVVIVKKSGIISFK